jgi:hypothetical protein
MDSISSDWAVHLSCLGVASDEPEALCCGHSGAWDKKSVGGDGANLIAVGTTPGLGRLVPARIERGV